MKKIAISVFALLAMAGAAQAQSIYAKAGLLGAGVGYAHGINSNLALRADVTTIGSFSHNGKSDKFDYDGKFKFNQANVYADWFPFGGGFSLTGGVAFRDANLTANARPNQNNKITIGDTEVSVGTSDTVTAKIEFPKVAPYIGFGWGHNVAAQKSGFSVFADVGVVIGKPKVSLNVSQGIMTALDANAPGTGQAEIDKQIRSIQDDADKIKVMPQLYVGVAYKF